MKIYCLRVMAATIAGGAMVAGPQMSPAWAQQAAARPKAGASVSTQALALLKQMGQSYQALASYSGAMKVEEFKAGESTRTSSGTIQWRKPNQFAIKFGNATGAMSATSDGATLVASTSTDKVRYIKSPAIKDKSALAAALVGTSAGSLALPNLLSGRSLIELLGLEADGNATSLAMGKEDKVGGEAVDVVLATQPGAAGTSSTQYSFALGQADHLLRQVKMSTGGAGRPFSPRATETLSDIKADAALPDSAFAFAPPAGAELVLSLQAPRYGATLQEGGKPFAFEAADLAGKPLNLEQYKGKVVLLDFWATWCPPCREEMPNVVGAYNRYSDEGFDIVGVSLDADRSALYQYIEANGMRWRQVFDGKAWDSRVPGIFGVRSIPFSLLIGRDGKITAMNPRGEALKPAIEAALDQQP